MIAKEKSSEGILATEQFVLNLNSLPKAKTKNRKRIGRGIGSGVGKTSGRGVKGQKARTGSSIKGFEGGQTPVYRRLPKKGFASLKEKSCEVVSIKNIFRVLSKRSDSTQEITKEKLKEFGLINDSNSTVKLIMSSDTLSLPKVKIAVDLYSEKAKIFKA